VNREGAAFCGNCGVKLVSLCPQCGTESPAEHLFCDRCGCDLGLPSKAPTIDYNRPRSYTPQSLADRILSTRNRIEGEQKLVTVLFADVADFTSIAEQLDPGAVHEIMGGFFRVLLDEIHRYEGMVDKFTGDGVMALFGAPLAHEDHAQRACHAALAMQGAIGEYGKRIHDDCGVEFKMRIGVNSGTVVVGSVGNDLKMDYTAIGDTVNLASRLEGAARPGTILVSALTHELARSYFAFEPVGRIAVKGKREPQEAYELVGTGEVETRIEASAAKGLTRFVGRGKEMGALREAFEEARAGPGQVVGIKGEAGVGKSRLLREFRYTLPEAEHRCLACTCLHYGASMVYLPILGVLRSYFDIQVGELEEDIQKKLREGLARLNGEFQGAVAPLQDVLSLTVEDEAYLQIDPQQRRRRIFETIRNLLICESLTRPLVLVMEDLHWIDRTSQDFLDFFVDAVSEAHILLLLLYRPEHSHTRDGRPHWREIRLDQLSGGTGADLVQAILGDKEVAPDLRDFILGRSGGNPLFAEELTRSLLEDGTIRFGEGQYVLSGQIAEREVPDTIQGIIASRMDRQEANLKRIMQVASVIGREFAYRILESITGMREELKTSLLQLQGLEFIYEKQLFPELEYMFKHALTQEVAYNSLLKKNRNEIHEKIGTAVEALFPERLEEYYELLAYHYVRSDNTVKAVEYLDLANQKAANANAPEAAKEYFDKAMEILDTLPDTDENRERRISMLPNQSNVFWKLMKGVDYYDLLIRYEPLLDRIGNSALKGQFYASKGLNEALFGYLDKGIQTLNEAIELLDASNAAEETAIAYYSLAVCHFLRCDYDRGFQLNEEYLRTMGDTFHLGSYVRLTGIVAQAYAQLGRWEEAVETAQQAVKVAQDYSDESSTAQAEDVFAAIYTYKGDPVKAIEHADRALGMASTPADKATAEAFLAWPLCHAGEARRGIEVLTGIVPIFKAVRLKWWELWGTFFLADGYWLAGEREKAKQTAEELLAIAEDCGSRYFIGYAHFLLGELSLRDDPGLAANYFEKSITVLREIKAENVLAMAYSGLGRYHKQQGNMEEARKYLTNALEIFERLGTLTEPDKVRKELAELPQ